MMAYLKLKTPGSFGMRHVGRQGEGALVEMNTSIRFVLLILTKSETAEAGEELNYELCTMAG